MTSEEQNTFEQQIQYSMNQAISGSVVHLFNGLIYVYIFRTLVELKWLFVWYAVVVLLALGRVVISIPVLRERLGLTSPKLWYFIYFSIITLIGIAWGSTGYFFFIPDEVIYQFFIAIVLTGFVCASIISLPVFLPVFYTFCTVVFLPVMVMLINSGHEVAFSVGILTVMMFLFTLVAGKRLHVMILDAITMRFKTEEIARLDSLTGIANRREFNRVYRKEFGRAFRNKSSIAILVIDIDHFKVINDTLGHLAGDDVLVKIALKLSNAIRRPTDHVARIGGEEFVIILPDTPLDGAVQVAEKIRSAIIRAEIEHPGSSCGPFVTISVGVCAGIPQDRHKQDMFIEKADKALYQAKRSGRNCCKAFGEEEIS